MRVFKVSEFMSGTTINQRETVFALCPACGMCCNGVLFGDVELLRGDHPRRLAALGMDLFRKGRKRCFSQPCACFDGKWCRIYDDRPSRCRTFECRLVQRVEAGRLSVAEALKSIKTARRQVEKVRALVRELGQTDEHMPLNRRYAGVLAEPMDMAGDRRVIKRRSRLLDAVGGLVALLERHFLA